MAWMLSEADFDKMVEQLNHTRVQKAQSFVACDDSDGFAVPQTQELS
jgi:hypothetical protein